MEEFKSKVSRLIGQQARVTFSSHSFIVTVYDIQPAKLGDLKNKPEMRMDEQGGRSTPAVVVFDCTPAGKLYFVLDDIERVNQTVDGLSIHMVNGDQVEFTCLS